ncbi:MAG: hypothetical protein HFE78_08630 [Clostridiales bacterium]|nr:hypothetical protein [Clostridiales bacterium]
MSEIVCFEVIHTTVQEYFKKSYLRNLFSGKSAVKKFLDLQKSMNQYGFTSYDLT